VFIATTGLGSRRGGHFALSEWWLDEMEVIVDPDEAEPELSPLEGTNQTS
jgi:hypothetical protein